MRRQLFERRFAVLRPLETQQLDFVELMHTQQTACVFAVRACFPTKTRRVGNVANGQ
jgi:hypothetical protein